MPSPNPKVLADRLSLQVPGNPMLAVRAAVLTFVDLLLDGLLPAGAEAHQAALSFYESLESAARRGMPDGQQAAADLAERFTLRSAPKASPSGAGPRGDDGAGTPSGA
jgi:hypothetical protein